MYNSFDAIFCIVYIFVMRTLFGIKQYFFGVGVKFSQLWVVSSLLSCKGSLATLYIFFFMN
uniref:Uncharacterized protein n=1 Tax=Cannabis sativa TaxID=3483 RepID=A0A803R447_CANSA